MSRVAHRTHRKVILFRSELASCSPAYGPLIALAATWSQAKCGRKMKSDFVFCLVVAYSVLEIKCWAHSVPKVMAVASLIVLPRYLPKGTEAKHENPVTYLVPRPKFEPGTSRICHRLQQLAS
jgi:hypothetical protein